MYTKYVIEILDDKLDYYVDGKKYTMTDYPPFHFNNETYIKVNPFIYDKLTYLHLSYFGLDKKYFYDIRNQIKKFWHEGKFRLQKIRIKGRMI